MAVLNEEQEMLRDMAREWTVRKPVTEFRKVRASGEPEAFNRDAYATMAQMGWAGSSSPKSMAGRTSASCPRASSSRNSARRSPPARW